MNISRDFPPRDIPVWNTSPGTAICSGATLCSGAAEPPQSEDQAPASAEVITSHPSGTFATTHAQVETSTPPSTRIYLQVSRGQDFCQNCVENIYYLCLKFEFFDYLNWSLIILIFVLLDVLFEFGTSILEEFQISFSFFSLHGLTFPQFSFWKWTW